MKTSFICFAHLRITINFHLGQLQQGVAINTEDGDQHCSIRWSDGMLATSQICWLHRKHSMPYRVKVQTMPKSWKSGASQNSWKRSHVHIFEGERETRDFL